MWLDVRVKPSLKYACYEYFPHDSRYAWTTNAVPPWDDLGGGRVSPWYSRWESTLKSNQGKPASWLFNSVWAAEKVVWRSNLEKSSVLSGNAPCTLFYFHETWKNTPTITRCTTYALKERRSTAGSTQYTKLRSFLPVVESGATRKIFPAFTHVASMETPRDGIIYSAAQMLLTRGYILHEREEGYWEWNSRSRYCS